MIEFIIWIGLNSLAFEGIRFHEMMLLISRRKLDLAGAQSIVYLEIIGNLLLLVAIIFIFLYALKKKES